MERWAQDLLLVLIERVTRGKKHLEDIKSPNARCAVWKAQNDMDVLSEDALKGGSRRENMSSSN